MVEEGADQPLSRVASSRKSSRPMHVSSGSVFRNVASLPGAAVSGVFSVFSTLAGLALGKRGCALVGGDLLADVRLLEDVHRLRHHGLLVAELLHELRDRLGLRVCHRAPSCASVRSFRLVDGEGSSGRGAEWPEGGG